MTKTAAASKKRSLKPPAEERVCFELYKSHICHRVKNEGDLNFILKTIKSDEIIRLFQKKWFPECFYLLAMVDYLCRENRIPICNKYDIIRSAKLKEIIYPSGIIMLCIAYNSDDPKKESLKEAIPEFLKYNIVESEIRNVC